MKPVKQELHNDCVRASVASILELPLSEVPNFADHPRGYYLALVDWCWEQRILLENTQPNLIPPGEFYLVWGESSPGMSHSVVYQDGKQVHNPSGAQIDPNKFLNYVRLVRLPKFHPETFQPVSKN